MRKILLSLVTIFAIGAIASRATVAYFSDTAVLGGNTFSAGSIDLQVNGQDEDLTAVFHGSDLKPGDTVDTGCVTLKNVGTLPGKLTVEVSNLVSNDNTLIEPESTDGDQDGVEVDPDGFHGNSGDGELWDQITTNFCIESGAGSHSTNNKCDWDDTIIKGFSSTQDDYSSYYSIPQNTDLAASKNIILDAGTEKTFCTGVKFIDDKTNSWWGGQGNLTNNMAMTDDAQLDFKFSLQQL